MPDKRFDWYQAFVKETSRLRWFILPLIALSVCDVLVTHSLLTLSPHFYESNPVANWIFTRYNFGGMIALKFGGIALAILIAEYVEHHRRHVGKIILIFGNLVTAGVVWYGLHLYFNAPLE